MIKKLLLSLLLMVGLTGVASAQTAWGAQGNPVAQAALGSKTGTIAFTYAVVADYGAPGNDGTALALGDVFDITITADNTGTVDADILVTLGSNPFATIVVGGDVVEGVSSLVAGGASVDIVLTVTLSSDPAVLLPNTVLEFDVTVATDAAGQL